MLLNFIKATTNASLHFPKVELILELKKLFIDKIHKSSIKCMFIAIFVIYILQLMLIEH